MNQPKHFYGKGLPHVDPTTLQGSLIVVEGSDGAGRTTQINLLSDWLQRKGFPTVIVGLKRSELVGEALTEAMQGHTLTPTTMSLFYATDFADQLERVILPALKSGFIVLADRYIYTLMARDLVRGGTVDWLRDLYGFALVPDAVFYLTVGPRALAERNFQKRGFLDYWESGMDIARAGDMYESFLKYQNRLHKTFLSLQRDYGFTTLNGMKNAHTVHKEIRDRVEKLLSHDRLPVEKPALSSTELRITSTLKPGDKP
jgi:dTMP kinase